MSFKKHLLGYLYTAVHKNDHGEPYNIMNKDFITIISIQLIIKAAILLRPDFQNLVLCNDTQPWD